MTVRQYFQLLAVAIPVTVLIIALIWPPIAWLLLVIVPIVFMGLQDMLQTRQTIRRLYPFVGRFRYMLESIRPEIQQYFVESDTSGTPFAREFRSLVYQRAKGDRDTRPFGTVFDVNRAGYEWINHSMTPRHPDPNPPKGYRNHKPCQSERVGSHR